MVSNNIHAIQTTTHMDDSEFEVLNLKKKDFHMKLVNLYSPNNKALSLNALPAVEHHYLVVGDFNSHSQNWGYDHIDKRGEEVENWQDDHRLNLINKPEDQPTFYSTDGALHPHQTLNSAQMTSMGKLTGRSENNVEGVIIVQCS